MEEIWKDIRDYEGLYQVSSYGRVKRLSRDVDVVRRKKGTNESRLEHWHKPEKLLYQTMYSTYAKTPYVRLVDQNGKRTLHAVKRLVAQAFVPNFDESITTYSICLKDPCRGIRADNIYFI